MVRNCKTSDTSHYVEPAEFLVQQCCKIGMLLLQLAAQEAEAKLVEIAKEVTAAKAAAGEWQARQTATQQQLAAREREASEQDAQIKVIT